MKEYITDFKDYRDLPFSKLIQDELFARHEHAKVYDDYSHTEEIVYKEKDVLILLQMMKQEMSYIQPICTKCRDGNVELNLTEEESWALFTFLDLNARCNKLPVEIKIQLHSIINKLKTNKDDSTNR